MSYMIASCLLRHQSIQTLHAVTKWLRAWHRSNFVNAGHTTTRTVHGDKLILKPTMQILNRRTGSSELTALSGSLDADQPLGSPMGTAATNSFSLTLENETCPKCA